MVNLKFLILWMKPASFMTARDKREQGHVFRSFSFILRVSQGGSLKIIFLTLARVLYNHHCSVSFQSLQYFFPIIAVTLSNHALCESCLI